jgi:hypothetical protein
LSNLQHSYSIRHAATHDLRREASLFNEENYLSPAIYVDSVDDLAQSETKFKIQSKIQFKTLKVWRWKLDTSNGEKIPDKIPLQPAS